MKIRVQLLASGLKIWAFLAAYFVLQIALQAAPEKINIRIGTLVPRGTSYHRNLMTMGQRWKTASNGSVRLTVFPDGIQGGESDMVGLMQTGNLDAGLLSAIGLSDIEPAVTALQSMPMAFRTLEEVDYVREKLRPMLEQHLLGKGYVVLFWVDSGWVRFFSKRLILHPDDLRRQKLFCWAGDAKGFDAWKEAGFQPVALETAGIPQGLLSGTIDAVPMPPFFALAGQMDLQAKYMIDLNWAPLVGACVVRKETWDRITPELQKSLLQIAEEIGLQVKADGRAESDASVVAMKNRGLIVTQANTEVVNEWRHTLDRLQDHIRGGEVPAEMYDEAHRLLDEYRAANGIKP